MIPAYLKYLTIDDISALFQNSRTCNEMLFDVNFDKALECTFEYIGFVFLWYVDIEIFLAFGR